MYQERLPQRFQLRDIVAVLSNRPDQHLKNRVDRRHFRALLQHVDSESPGPAEVRLRQADTTVFARSGRGSAGADTVV